MLVNIIKQFETQPIIWKCWKILINAKKCYNMFKNTKNVKKMLKDVKTSQMQKM